MNTFNALVADARQRIAAAMAGSRRPMLCFSGGKDSLVCLYLLRPHWDRLAVVWANAGDPYPETLDLMERVRPLVSEFYMVTGACLEDAAANGFPTDMMPMPATVFGRHNVRLGETFLMQASYVCCSRNFWEPLHAFTQKIGADLLIRGERDDEVKRSPMQDGGVDHLGRKVLLPVAPWTKADVLAYLAGEGIELPRQYAHGLPSLDCMHCTAYLDESANKLPYLRQFHPQVATEFERRLTLVHRAQIREMRFTALALGRLDGAPGEGHAD